jgi:hypothetical protein
MVDVVAGNEQVKKNISQALPQHAEGHLIPEHDNGGLWSILLDVLCPNNAASQIIHQGSKNKMCHPEKT